MATAVTIVLVLVVVAEVAVWFLIRPRDPGDDEVATGHLWAVAHATTRDGVTAHLQVEVTLAEDASAPVASATLVDALQDALRNRITAATVVELPALGDDPAFDADELPAGVRLAHSRVTISDVEVSGALRRLVSSRPSAPETSG